MKCAMPTAITTRRVVPRETRIVLDPAMLVTGMREVTGLGVYALPGPRAWGPAWQQGWITPMVEPGFGWAGRYGAGHGGASPILVGGEERRSWSDFLRSLVRLRR